MIDHRLVPEADRKPIVDFGSLTKGDTVYVMSPSWPESYVVGKFDGLISPDDGNLVGLDDFTKHNINYTTGPAEWNEKPEGEQVILRSASHWVFFTDANPPTTKETEMPDSNTPTLPRNGDYITVTLDDPDRGATGEVNYVDFVDANREHHVLFEVLGEESNASVFMRDLWDGNVTWTPAEKPLDKNEARKAAFGQWALVKTAIGVRADDDSEVRHNVVYAITGLPVTRKSWSTFTAEQYQTVADALSDWLDR